jgi:tRNA1(Val) A37 N6-methylase TrmN6
MTGVLVWIVGFLCGLGMAAFFCARRLEDVEQKLFDAQAELANLRAVAAWRQKQ